MPSRGGISQRLRDQSRGIDLFGLGHSVWRHRVVALAVLAIVLVATAAYVHIQEPVYQSTETLQLAGTDASFLAETNSLTPLYAELLTAQQTLNLAQHDLGVTRLAAIAVRTFTNSPVLDVDASSGSASAARDSAAAVVRGLSQRLSPPSKLGVPDIAVVVIDGPSQPQVTWPRPALTLGVAAMVGILLGVITAWLADRPWQRQAIPAIALASPPAMPVQDIPAATSAAVADSQRIQRSRRPIRRGESNSGET